MKKTGPVAWPEVAGGGRNRSVKVAATVKVGEREKHGWAWVSRNGNPPKVQLAIYSKSFPTSVDHNFFIRTSITTYFVSTNSV